MTATPDIKSPIRDTRRSIPLALLSARESIMAHYRPLLAEIELTEQQWRVIRVLFESEPLEISELARNTSVLPPSMSGILKRLESRKLVSRTADTGDQRRCLISLTAKAHTLVLRAAPESERLWNAITEQFGESKLEQLLELLDELESLPSVQRHQGQRKAS